MEQREQELRCNFCGKQRSQVQLLVASVYVAICNECINVCVQTLAQEAPRRGLTLPDLLPSLHGISAAMVAQDNIEEKSYGLY